MKTIWMLAGVLLLGSAAAQAVVTVENTVAAQAPGTKIVTLSYDVSSDITNAVSITLKAFNGESEVVLTSLSGDVGPGVATGTGRTIIWNAGADWNGHASDSLKFWVLADDSTAQPLEGVVAVPAGIATGTDPDFGAFSLMLTNSLYADQFEVTKAVWDPIYTWAVTNGYEFDNDGTAVSNTHPVTAVSWYDCVKWCNARSEMEGLTPCYTVTGSVYRTGWEPPDLNAGGNGYRLPTSDEWEYLARAGTHTRYPFGDLITHDDANYYSSSAYGYDVSPSRGFHPDFGPDWPRTSPVGSFLPNANGLYDTVGNVWEWCWDEDVSDGSRLQRGGSWIDGADAARCGSGFLQFPYASSTYSGFRTVRNSGASTLGTAATLVDARDYTLAVVSLVGSSTPPVGLHVYAWGSSVTCSVDSVVVASDTVYIGKGWTGSGSIPASGTTNTTGLIALSETHSTIVWNWVADNDYDGLPNDWEMAYYGSATGAVASADTDGDGYTSREELLLGTDPTKRLSQLNLQITVSTNGAPLISCSTAVGRTYTFEYKDSLTSTNWTSLVSFDGTGGTVQYEDSGSIPNRSYRVLVQYNTSYGVMAFWEPQIDSDGDGLPNDWEMTYYGSTTGAVASADTDGDGYTSREELLLGTDPTNGMSQLNLQITVSTNGAPLISCSTVVGRTYILEYKDSLTATDWTSLVSFDGTGGTVQYEDSGSIPNRSYRIQVQSNTSDGGAAVWGPRIDSDGDQLPNDWEWNYFGTTEGASASQDSDLDGYSNLDELLLGTDPTNSLSNLNFTVAPVTNGTAAISCSTAPGRIYIIEYTDSLTPANWQLLGGFVGTGATGQYLDPDAVPNRYYRMSVELPPGVEP